MMTPKERAAMQQALDMMEFAAKYPGVKSNSANLTEVSQALREALAEPQITTPDVCGEVCARAKLCYGCNKDLEEANAKYAEQAEQEHSADTGNMVYSNPSVFDGVCCGCSKKAADGWALYCVECWEKSNGDPFANGGKMIAEQAEQEPVAIVEDWPTDSTPKGIVALCDIKELPAGTLLYASPASSTEVFTREKVDSLLIAAYTKGRNDLLEKQAEQEPVALLQLAEDALVYHTEQTRPIQNTIDALAAIQKFKEKQR